MKQTDGSYQIIVRAKQKVRLSDIRAKGNYFEAALKFCLRIRAPAPKSRRWFESSHAVRKARGNGHLPTELATLSLNWIVHSTGLCRCCKSLSHSGREADHSGVARSPHRFGAHHLLFDPPARSVGTGSENTGESQSGHG